MRGIIYGSPLSAAKTTQNSHTRPETACLSSISKHLLVSKLVVFSGFEKVSSGFLIPQCPARPEVITITGKNTNVMTPSHKSMTPGVVYFNTSINHRYANIDHVHWTKNTLVFLIFRILPFGIAETKTEVRIRCLYAAVPVQKFSLNFKSPCTYVHKLIV